MGNKWSLDDTGYDDGYKDGYEQGRADKYKEITSEYMLLTEKQVEEIREDAIGEELQRFAQWLWDNHYLVDEAFTIRLVEQYKLEQMKEQKKMRVTVELPCAVGETAYYVHRNGVQGVTVDSFIFNTNLFANVSYYIGCERFSKTLTPYKTLFFTKEEALKMWEKMKEKKNERD